MNKADLVKSPVLMPDTSKEEWNEVIQPFSKVFDLRFREVWRYRDLLMLMVRRDLVATYKQTILGPLWFFIQPALTTLTFMLVFSRIAGISTDGIPPMVFYLAGITLWNYFAECLSKTAVVFKDNAPIFGKVYFPRIVMPLSIVVSNLVKLGIQMILFVGVWLYFLFVKEGSMDPNWAIALTPVLVFIMGGLGLGFGMLISALTTKYRDLVFLLTFGIQLLMYATPVIYPLSALANSKYKWLLELNPMSSVIETFRYAFLGRGEFTAGGLIYSSVFTIVVVLIGALVFNKVEKNFMDSI